MSGLTTIEWTEATWNPVTGCDKVSPGCAHCYAEVFAERFRGVPGHPYEQGFDLRLWPERLALPLRWRKPRRVFVNSMSDLFHERVPDAFVGQVFEVMEQARQHTFQVLTKRPERLAKIAHRLPWPPNVWMGVSIENRRFLHRADMLRRLPEPAVRFVSAEPLLGPLDGLNLDGLDWVIVGGESGPRARPMDLAWARDLVARCRAAGVAVFVKQLGTRWAGRGKGNDPASWPADLRVRELPQRPAATVFEIAPLAVDLNRRLPGGEWYDERGFYIGLVDRVERLGEMPRAAAAAMVALAVERWLGQTRLADSYPWLPRPLGPGATGR